MTSATLEKAAVAAEKYLVTEWKTCYKLYSFWFILLLGSIPDLYNMAINAHVIEADRVPALFSYIVNVISFLTLASRFVKQKAKEAETGDAPTV